MNIGIIGYGKMGSAILKLLANGHHPIVVLNRSEEKAKEREKKFIRGLEGSFKRGVISENTFLERKENVKFTHRWEDLAPADIVIETIVEKDEEKTELFETLESVLGKKTILVTNTSSLSIKKLAEKLKHKERFCGLHFFYPVILIDLVEIIKWKDNQTELVGFLKDFCNQIGKRPIVVLDSPGSVINAILAYSYIEAMYLLEEGLALPSAIDETSRQFFYIGPCESMDVVGIDFFITALSNTTTPASLLPFRWSETPQTELSKEETQGREGFFTPHLFRRLMAENRFGKKVSKGIYLYQGKKPIDDAPEFYINPYRYDSIGDLKERNTRIAMRMLYSIFNGSIYSLRKVISSLEELDMGIKEVLQMKEGPFTMMKGMGEKKVRQDFELLTRTEGKRFHQTRFEFLNEMT